MNYRDSYHRSGCSFTHFDSLVITPFLNDQELTD